MASNLNLLSSTNRIEIPFIKVKIGDYTFGACAANTKSISAYNNLKDIQFPNYIKSLSIVKINGQVNTYTLNLTYPIRPGDDPNFFEKIFSNVSVSRSITFSYGDYSVPNYYYKDEKAIITKVTTSFDRNSATISYIVNAVSSGALGYSIKKSYGATHAKPSEIIYKILKDDSNGLGDLFYGLKPYLKNTEQLRSWGIIAGGDKAVDLEYKNTSPIEYIQYLVNSMIPQDTLTNKTKSKAFYAFTIHDENENNVKYKDINGPYFTITRVEKDIQYSDAYEITLGYPSGNLVTNFSYENNENYSLLYDYQESLDINNYVERVNAVTGEITTNYSPALISSSGTRTPTAIEKNWYTKLTEYPVSASITIKGLLRPALLMEYVKLNVIFHGRKHISSGIYIITKQTDQIDGSGYRTTLNLTRIASDPDFQ